MIKILEAKDLSQIPGNAAYEIVPLYTAKYFDKATNLEEYRQLILPIAQKYVGKSMSQEEYNKLDEQISGGPEHSLDRAIFSFSQWVMAACGFKIIKDRNRNRYDRPQYESIEAIAAVLVEDKVLVRYTKHQKLLKEELERRGYTVTLIGS